MTNLASCYFFSLVTTCISSAFLLFNQFITAKHSSNNVQLTGVNIQCRVPFISEYSSEIASTARSPFMQAYATCLLVKMITLRFAYLNSFTCARYRKNGDYRA